MGDLFKAELLRFRAWAIAYALVHVAVLGFLTRVVDLAQQPLFTYQIFGGAYALSGLLLGAYQIGSYRRPNAWLNLLHRPVAQWRLAAALVLAAATLLFVGVLLPMLVTAAWQEAMTARVLDARHLLLALSGWLLALCGYLTGAYALLANRRHAVAGFVFLAGLCLGAASGAGAIVVQLLALAWLGAMVRVSFKPDLAAPPRGPVALAVVALPLMMAMWFALRLLGFGYEVAWLMQGSHPNNLPVPIPGSAKEADNAKGPELMALGLKASRDPDAALWREQAAISDVYTLGPSLDALPARDQLTNVAPMEFDDDLRRTRWVFSHDDMRFHGYTLAGQRAAGVLGVDGSRPFPEPPLPLPQDLLASRGALYQFDQENDRILPRARVPNGERIVGLGDAGERIALLTQRALYLYDARDLKTSDGPLQPRLRVPLPAPVGKLSRVDLMELVDGALVSFTFTRNVYRGEALPEQVIVRADESGGTTRVARRVLPSGYGDVFLHRNWYASPLLFAVQQRVARLFAGYQPEFDVAPMPRPRVAVAIAGVLMALSMLLAAWRTRRIAVTPAARVAWIVVCALVGIPALLALWLLYPPRERLDELPLAAAARA